MGHRQDARDEANDPVIAINRLIDERDELRNQLRSTNREHETERGEHLADMKALHEARCLLQSAVDSPTLMPEVTRDRIETFLKRTVGR